MTRESSYVVSVDIDATPQSVWDLVCDATKYPDWVEGTLKVFPTDGPLRLGSRYDELTRMMGPWKAKTSWTVTAFDPIRRQVHEGTGIATARGWAVELEIAPKDERTRFTLMWRYTPRFGALGVLLDQTIKGKLARSQQNTANALVAVCARVLER